MSKWIFSQGSTSQSIMDYLLKGNDCPDEPKHPAYPIGIYVFGVDEVRSKVVQQVEESINAAGKNYYLSRTMFSLPYFGANDIKIMLIDLRNVASRGYSSHHGTTGGTVDSLPDYGLRREAADRLRKAGAKMVIAIYAKVTNPDHLLDPQSIECAKYLCKTEPHIDSPASGDVLITIEETAPVPW